MNQLSRHAALVDGPDLWVEGEAVTQLERAAALPGCVRAVGMPDLHPGPGYPIGVALAFRHTLVPHLVGGDAGCGVRVVAVPRLKHRGDALERRLRHETDAPMISRDPEAFALAWREGLPGFARWPELDDGLAAWLKQLAPLADDNPSGPVPGRDFSDSLGTIGGGNHFLEVAKVGELVDPPAAARSGLKRDGYAVVAHSGSRGIGRYLIDKWGATPLTGAAAQDYLADLSGARRYASVNRALLCWRALRAIGAAATGRIAGSFDLCHNDIVVRDVDGEATWLHRKGAAPAEPGAPTIVLGSRGAASWVMEGLGGADALWSVAHGAGRRMTRAEAVDKLRARYPRRSLSRTAIGSRVICDDPKVLYAEHPDAYKPMAPILAATEKSGAARPVAELVPIMTAKR